MFSLIRQIRDRRGDEQPRFVAIVGVVLTIKRDCKKTNLFFIDFFSPRDIIFIVMFSKQTNKGSDLASRRRDGFTLIELLVVIAIIGMLSSIVLASLNGARVKAQNARTKIDARQIILALELYYDSNGFYPVTSGWVCLKPSGSCWIGNYSGNAGVINALSPYISSIPLTQARQGEYSYDSYLYVSNHGGAGIGEAGAYLIWSKKGSIANNECPPSKISESPIRGPYPNEEYHCYQYIGK